MTEIASKYTTDSTVVVVRGLDSGGAPAECVSLCGQPAGGGGDDRQKRAVVVKQIFFSYREGLAT